MSKIFITGIAGFLGSTLARRCAEMGWEVHGIDLIPRSDARRLAGVDLKSYTWGSMIDIRQPLPPVEYVVHAAAVADVPFAMKSPAYTLQQNIMATQGLLEALVETNAVYNGIIQRVIVQSSESVYGHSYPGRIPEESPLNPTNIYAASKAACEMVARSYYHAHDLPVTIIRSSTIFGEGMRQNQVVPIFLRQAMRDEPITVHGDGKQSRDFNFILNAVEGILRVLATPAAAGDVFNIAGDNEVSIADLAHACIQATNSRSEVRHVEQRPGEQDLHLVPDITHARAVLNYQPLVSFEEGLERTARWFEPVFRGAETRAAR